MSAAPIRAALGDATSTGCITGAASYGGWARTGKERAGKIDLLSLTEAFHRGRGVVRVERTSPATIPALYPIELRRAGLLSIVSRISQTISRISQTISRISQTISRISQTISRVAKRPPALSKRRGALLRTRIARGGRGCQAALAGYRARVRNGVRPVTGWVGGSVLPSERRYWTAGAGAPNSAS
jgi:hypothetical protein